MRMPINRFLVVLSVFLLSGGPIFSLESNRPEINAPASPAPAARQSRQPRPAESPPAQELFSPSVSQLFYEMAYETSRREDITDAQAQEAILLLNAAMELDISTSFAAADMLTILSRPGRSSNLQLLYDSLIKYVSKESDCMVAANAVRYLLEQLDSRKQREVLLSRLIRDVGEYNLTLRSELATELGLLYAERADDPNAARILAIAYNWDRYNQLAYDKLVELVPEQISPVLHLEHLRLKIRKNPLDIYAAVAFAQYARKLELYDTAAGGFQYCADLFGFLLPGREMPAPIYQDWILCHYNAPRGQQKCLQLAEQLRKQGLFDLQIEAFAARAAAKAGDTNTAVNIIKSAEEKAISRVSGNQQIRQSGADSASSPQADFQSLAWFYCFVLPDAGKALDYANKAYSIDPNSPDAAGLLACAFADNNKPDLAKLLLDNYPQTQFASYAQALISLAAGQKQPAIDSLRTAIDKDPGSLVAEQAHRLLAEQQADYIPIFDTNLILANLKQGVGEQIVPHFISPDQMLSFKLNIKGTRFSYGNDIAGAVSITNNGFEELVISEDGLCTGRIVIDAKVTGDLQAQFEKLVTTTTRPAEPLLPGRSVLVPVRLLTGALRDMLIRHPQASLKIHFTAYLDPVVSEDDEITSAIPGIKPDTVEIERPCVEITTDYLENRFQALSKGKQGPKIRAARLFSGLMMESQEMQNRQPPYKLVSADWIDSMLKSALVYGLTDSDWVVRVHTMAAIEPISLDYELTDATARGLNDQHWPVRMMAVALLARKQPDSFAKVLDHTARFDASEFVRNMAVVFGAKVPEPNQPLEQPFLKLLQQEPNADANSVIPPLE